jgi:hypothetical protein
MISAGEKQMTITISSQYVLTTDHAASSYNQPVLVRVRDNSAYGPKDMIDDGVFGQLPAAEVVADFARVESLKETMTHGGVSPSADTVAAVNNFLRLAGL